MAREALTTTWEEIATSVTGAFVQNTGGNVVQIAFAAAVPEAGVNAGFILQKGDFAPISGLASTNLYARAVTGASEIEHETVA